MAERKKKLPNRHVFSDDELEAPPVSIIYFQVYYSIWEVSGRRKWVKDFT